MNKLKKVERYSRLYIQGYLSDDIRRKDVIYRDWYEALKFFFHKSFYRGRRDEISKDFENKTLATLEEYRLKEKYPRIKKAILEKHLRKNGVANHVDRKMVLQTLAFIGNLENYNIVRHAVKKIRRGVTKELFDDLNGIYGVGDKLAGLFLRDVALVYKLEKKIKEEDLVFFQPVDTWVKQVAVQLKILGLEDRNIEEIKRKITNSCVRKNVSPLLFNAGAWYIGSHSFEILINTL